MRVGFLFNHDQIHQVAHSLPVAVALAERAPEMEIVVATTNPVMEAEVQRVLKLLPARPRLSTVRLSHRSLAVRAAVAALNRLLPAAKLAIYRDNLPFFRALDALVVTEKTSTLLRSHYGLDDLKLIHTRHGAGDRAIGFDSASALFDLVLVSGPKIRDRLIAEAGVAPDRIAMVGYPKFDVPTGTDPPRLPEKRPTVLYNPHLTPHLSSWYRHGRQILDFFLDSDRYNLIFAPHVMLFERKIVMSVDKKRLNFPGRLDRKYFAAPHLHIDLGSIASTDMSYTQAADLYLGDVSSQIYEFLVRPRPAVFVNSHGRDYQGDPNFAHWRTGVVIDDPSDLERALESAIDKHAGYLPAQLDLFRSSIDLTDVPSSTRAADAIARFLGSAEQTPRKSAGASQ